MLNQYKLHSKILTASEEVDMARRLVYQVYVEEGQWRPSVNNPSGFEILKSPNSLPPRLIDRFDDYSTWLGIFDGTRVEPIACGRISSRDQHGKFEMQYYSERLTHLKQINIQSNPQVFVIGKSAILPEYRGTAAWLMLLRQAFLFCHEHKHSVFSSTTVGKVQNVHDSIGYPSIEGVSVKYEFSDDNAKVYYATYPVETLKVIENLDKLIDKKLEKDNGEVVLKAVPG
jgi:hypothetical protein